MYKYFGLKSIIKKELKEIKIRYNKTIIIKKMIKEL